MCWHNVRLPSDCTTLVYAISKLCKDIYPRNFEITQCSCVYVIFAIGLDSLHSCQDQPQMNHEFALALHVCATSKLRTGLAHFQNCATPQHNFKIAHDRYAISEVLRNLEISKLHKIVEHKCVEHKLKYYSVVVNCQHG